MKGPIKFITLLLILVTYTAVQAQEARLFLDLPSIYLHSPNLEAISNNAGAGADQEPGQESGQEPSQESGQDTADGPEPSPPPQDRRIAHGQ